MFHGPSFTFWNVVYTAIGAGAFWNAWGRSKLKPFLVADLIRRLPGKRWHPYIEFFLFIALGVVVGIGVTSPTNAQQAIAAGMSFTGVFAHRKM